MHLSIGLVHFFLPLISLAVPITTDSEYQSHDKFTLKSHVLAPANPAFENLYLEPYHISPAVNYATLYPKSGANQGVIGYLNGTEQELEDDQGNLLFEAGPAGVYGFVIGVSSPLDIVFLNTNGVEDTRLP